MAEFNVPTPEEVEITEDLTLSFTQYGNERKWKLKKRNNLSLKVDDVVAGALLEAFIGEVVDDEQSAFRKFITPLWTENKITSEEIGAMFTWLGEERERIYRAAVTAKAGNRPSGDA